ncbi:MAG: ATP phosphoribosyltransferase regulatory subunit [Lachnospiraceae bacterium]
MKNQLLHTPEGVRDIYAEECARKQTVQKEIQSVFHLYGYQNIETPTFEFFDIFKKERGSVVSSEMYKFFDRDNNTLVLRPDMTPSIARCVAKYYMDETMPLRLCYLEPAFLNGTSYQGRLKETTQTGVELIGDASSDADAEMIVMVVDALKASGLQEFQVDLGQVEFYRGLVEESGMDDDTQEQLHELVENKNYFGVETLLSKLEIKPELKQVFLKLPELFGDIEQIRLAKSMTTNERALKAIERLEHIQEILDGYGVGEYISYDLSMLSKYSYYTGIIFKAYTYGTGEYVVTGGRYDKLLIQFGKDTPAIGFMIVIDQLMLALSRQNIEIPADMVHTIILYGQQDRQKAIVLAQQFRSSKIAVQLIRKPSAQEVGEYTAYAKRHHIRNLLYLIDNGTRVQVWNTEQGSAKVLDYADYIHETELWRLLI